MHFGRIVALSLMAGFVVGGFVWYGWGLVENLAAALRQYLERRRLAAEQAAREKRAAIEQEVKREQEERRTQ